MIVAARIFSRYGLVALLAMLHGAAFAAEPQVQVGVSQSGEVFTVEATVEAPVTRKTAWDVLTDFDHMSAFSASLTSSKVVSRQDNILVVKQEGVAKAGLFSFSFRSEREIHLEPMQRISSRDLSGTAKRMESETRIVQSGEAGQGIQIRYHAEIVPDSVLARMFGASYLRRQVEEQFRFIVAEMQRREAGQAPLAALQVSKSGG